MPNNLTGDYEAVFQVRLRQINGILPPGFNCHRIVAVEVYTPSGNWSSYPPHKHDIHREDAIGTLLEADLEEIYFYKFDRPGGYAYQRVYTPDRSIDGVMMTQQAYDAGAREAILLRDGFIQEGASSNVFAVVDGLLWTAPVGHFILAGITRDLVLELARRHGLPLREEPLPLAEFQRASEVWITSSTREIVPVAQVDGRLVGDGSTPVLQQVWAWYRAFRRNPVGH